MSNVKGSGTDPNKDSDDVSTKQKVDTDGDKLHSGDNDSGQKVPDSASKDGSSERTEAEIAAEFAASVTRREKDLKEHEQLDVDWDKRTFKVAKKTLRFGAGAISYIGDSDYVYSDPDLAKHGRF